MANWHVSGYEIDIVVQGFPGKSICHGELGWSSIVLLRGHGRVALVDVGAFGIRKTLISRLKAWSVKPVDITDVILTHSHYDHSINWTLFNHARLVIGRHELDWAIGEPWGETPVPELYVRELKNWPTCEEVEDGEEILPGLRALIAPGHTPGHLIFVLKGQECDVIITGDAAKNRAELISRKADMAYDAEVSSASIEKIWEMWQARSGNLLIPGHDLPMKQEGGVPRYIARREAAIKAWFDDNLEKTTNINLVIG